MPDTKIVEGYLAEIARLRRRVEALEALTREAQGLLRLIAEEALGNDPDEYVSIPQTYIHEALRVTALRGEEKLG